MRKNSSLLRSASWSCLSLLVLATPALAQDAAAADEPDARDEIIVTAQKRAENIQDVPIAITALTGEAIEKAKIEDGKDLQFNVPNVTLSANRNLTIRGVGSASYGGTGDTNIGQLVNGVFLQSGSTFGDFFDVERIEVLRGPQGTLFGRNTTGGVVNYITKRPTDRFEGYAEGQYESFNGVKLAGALNIPLGDKLSQRFSGQFLRRDGYTTNLATGHRIDGRHQYSLRSSTRFRPDEDTDINLTLFYYNENSSRIGAVKSLCTPDPTFGCSPDSVSTQFPTRNFPIDSIFLPGVVRAGTFVTNPTNLREVNISLEPVSKADDFLATLEISREMGPITVTSVTGWRDGSSSGYRDFTQGARPNAFNPGTFATPTNDGSGNGLLTYLVLGQPVTTTSYITSQSGTSTAKQFSQELRFSTNFKGPFNALAGLYYFNARGSGNVTTWVPAGRTNGFIASGDTPLGAVKSMAAFGEVYIEPTPTLKITGGIRYSVDDKKIKTASGTFVLAPYFNGKASFNATTGRVAVDWNPIRETNVYLTYAKGFKSGGFNPGNATVPTFDSEFVNSWELGIKNQLFDNRMRLNVAAFNYDYRNLIVGNIVGTLATNVNIPKSRVRGLEVEATVEPVDGLRFEGALGLLDARIRSNFLSSDPTRGGAFFQIQNNYLPNAPKRTLKLAAEYNLNLDNEWSVTPRVDFYSQTGFFSREFNTGADRVESWKQLDFQLTIANGPDRRLNLFVKNVLDEDSITFLEANSNLVGSFRSAFLLDPRTFGVSLHLGF